jgi:succinate-semialdehyde dehydrogenase / glutarate-semialdehyde dehydrogenase
VISVVDPTSGALVETYEPTPAADLDGMVATASSAQTEWASWPINKRGDVLRSAARVLREGRETYAALIVREMGKPIGEARAEIEKCAWTCEYYADDAQRALADLEVDTNAESSFVTWEPIGLVLAIMPWNFPFFQVFRFAAPALVAGNGCLLKHASNVSGCALAVAEVWRDAGVPNGLFTSLLVEDADAAATTERLLDNAA